MDNVLVIGYFGYCSNKLDGQTVKTRQIYQLLKENNIHTSIFDTELFVQNKFFVFKMFVQVLRARKLLYLPAQNNLKILFPIIFILSKVFRIDIQYFVIGGWLVQFLEKNPLHRYLLKKISGIHVETYLMCSRLQKDYRFNNVDVFPNFRFFNYVPKVEKHDKLKVVFFARILQEKGVDMVFAFADYIKACGLASKITIDFYGPLLGSITEYFNNECSKYSFVKYHGILQVDEIYPELNKYDVLVLPTHFYTEGLPGSVVDAYISGLPVVVTKWLHATEFIDNEHTGFIVPFINGQDEFNQAILKFLHDPMLLQRMKYNAIEKSKQFSSDFVWEKMKRIVGV